MGKVLKLGPLCHAIGEKTLVMGILNVTPDSFSDGGQHDSLGEALTHARTMVEEGADIIDIGGESTRPGAAEVSAEEEAARVLPVIERLSGTLERPISIDSYKASVAEAAVGFGATIVNDVWGLQRDAGMAAVIADTGASAILMHNRDKADPAIDILDDVRAFFDRSLRLASDAGIPEDRIVLDPGIGFGKTVEQNVDLIANLGALKAMGFPVLIGVSRKSMVGYLIGKPVDERLHGTIAANVAAVLAGADIVRVHDVAAHIDAMKVTDAVRGRRHD